MPSSPTRSPASPTPSRAAKRARAAQAFLDARERRWSRQRVALLLKSVAEPDTEPDDEVICDAIADAMSGAPDANRPLGWSAVSPQSPAYPVN